MLSTISIQILHYIALGRVSPSNNGNSPLRNQLGSNALLVIPYFYRYCYPYKYRYYFLW